MAVLFGFAGLFGNPMLLLIAVFVWIGAGQEAAAVEVKSSFTGVTVRAAMLSDFRTLAPTQTVGEAARLLLAGSQQDFPILDRGRVVGVLAHRRLFEALREREETAPIAELMDGEFQVADADEPLDQGHEPARTGRLHHAAGAGPGRVGRASDRRERGRILHDSPRAGESAATTAPRAARHGRAAGYCRLVSEPEPRNLSPRSKRTTVMTDPLTQTEKESILTLCLMAAFADGGKNDLERAELKRIAENFPESDVNLAGLYHRVLLRQVSTAQTAQALTNAEARQLAYEMAVCVCEADDVLNEPERQFLAELRRELRLDTAETARIEQQANTLAVEPLAEPASTLPPVIAAAPAATNAAVASPEVDKMVLNYALLNGALELLPDSLATMAIIPLQMKMVYRVGKHYGYELDRGHIKELLGGGRGPDFPGRGRLRPQAVGRTARQGGRRPGQVSGQARRRFRDVLRKHLGLGPTGAAILRRWTQALRHRTSATLRFAHGTGARFARQLRQRHPRKGRLVESHAAPAPDPRAAVSGHARSHKPVQERESRWTTDEHRWMRMQFTAETTRLYSRDR